MILRWMDEVYEKKMILRWMDEVYEWFDACIEGPVKEIGILCLGFGAMLLTIITTPIWIFPYLIYKNRRNSNVQKVKRKD